MFQLLKKPRAGGKGDGALLFADMLYGGLGWYCWRDTRRGVFPVPACAYYNGSYVLVWGRRRGGGKEEGRETTHSEMASHRVPDWVRGADDMTILACAVCLSLSLMCIVFDELYVVGVISPPTHEFNKRCTVPYVDIQLDCHHSDLVLLPSQYIWTSDRALLYVNCCGKKPERAKSLTTVER